MSISTQRLSELTELYSDIKESFRLVDEKYSLVAAEPQLDMPESLNLKKLAYTPKTQEELNAAAELSTAAAILSKQNSVERSYSAKLKSISQKQAEVLSDADMKANESVEAFNAEKEEIARKLVDNGLVFSTIAVKFNDLASQHHIKRMEKISSRVDHRTKLIESEQADAEQLYTESCEALQREKEARIAEALRRLAEEEEKQRIAVEKYNNSLEEKEQKYQASRARAYESAYRARQNTALQNAKLYAELGETGYRDLIQKEKYSICVKQCAALTREEGNALLGFDGFLRTELGSYYSTFVNWVNTALIPA